MAVHLTLTEGVEVRVLTGQQRGIDVPLLNIVRWRNGNAMFLDEVQPGEAVAGSSPVRLGKRQGEMKYSLLLLLFI